jgi:polyphosphate kinase 2 (PPK2 family)
MGHLRLKVAFNRAWYGRSKLSHYGQSVHEMVQQRFHTVAAFRNSLHVLDWSTLSFLAELSQ